MKRGKSFIVKLVIYPFDILVTVGQEPEDRAKAIDRYCQIPSSIEELTPIIKLHENRTCFGRCIMTTCNRIVLALKNYPSEPKDHGVLAHEIFHAATFLMNRIGNEFVVGKCDESYAYLIDYITQEIYKEIHKKPRPRVAGT